MVKRVASFEPRVKHGVFLIQKTGFKPVFENSAVRCDVVTHRGIEPRSTPSESATLSVELMGHILIFRSADARIN